MRNWALLTVAIAIGAIGCGGAGGGSSSTSGGGGGGGVVPGGGPVVLLESKPGSLEFSYLTGQGRSSFAPGDTQAFVELPDLTDSRGSVIVPPVDSQVRLQLNGYQNSISRVNTPISNLLDTETGRPLNSRLFQNYQLKVLSVRQEGFDFDFESSTIVGIPSAGYPVNVRTFPGRFTNLPLFLNDAMFTPETDPDTGTSFFRFNTDQFNQANGLDVQPRINSSLSDYVVFDLRGMAAADRPTLLSGTPAYRVFFSGDNYALAAGRGFTDIPAGDQTSEFNAITRTDLNPDSPADNLIDGLFALPGQLSLVPGITGTTPGTYSLLQLDPSDPFLVSRVTSLQGIWRDHYKMVGNMPEAMAIAFPNSRDNEEQDIVVFRQTIDRTGSTITGARINQFYYGTQNLNTGQVRLYPLRNLTSGSRTGEVIATVGNLKDRNNAPTQSSPLVRKGEITGLTIPGIPGTVPMVVYRY